MLSTVLASTAAPVAQPLPIVSKPSRLLTTEPFTRFGRWAPSISVARDGTIPHLARWLALHAPQYLSAAESWDRCRAANPTCFRTYRVVALDAPSFFLPAGEVVFEAIENPTQIPDRPPQGVMLRHMEALDTFAAATFYFLRPVFVTEPTLRLLTADELRREAHFDHFDAIRRARQLGWLYRSQAWLRKKRDAAAFHTLRAVTRFVESLAWEITPAQARTIDPATRRRLRHELESRLENTEYYGLARESRRLEIALEELRRRITIDPVLAFEVASRPGELWFEAHWFEAAGGRTYVHY